MATPPDPSAEQPYDFTPLMTAADVALTLRVSVGTVRNWAYQRRLPSVKINGCLRFREDQIRAFITAGRRA